MNKVLKTVLHLSLLIIGPTVALMLAHRWPTGGPPVAQLACHMPLLGQRWPTGQNDVGPPVAANGGPTAEPPGSCYLGSVHCLCDIDPWPTPSSLHMYIRWCHEHAFYYDHSCSGLEEILIWEFLFHTYREPT